ncbi:MAG: hypothetical protein WCE54_13120 [Ignavibacteriaceae bacterium]
MKSIIISSVSFLLFLSIISCNTTEPPEDNLQPGRRDYIWTMDSLKSDLWFGLSDMWGSSPTNIWMVAGGITGWDCLWHYDGVNWTRYNEYLNPALNTVFGINPDEVWIGDTYSTIWKFDGNTWKIFQTFSLSGFDHIDIGSIYGTSQNNLYAVGAADNYDGSGYKGVVLRYDGTRWSFLNIPEIRVGFHKIRKIKNGKYLIWGETNNNGFLEKLFVFDGNNNLKEIYSDYPYPGIYEMNGDTYITINSKIYKCENDQLVLWKEFPGTSYTGVVLGRSEKDFFGAGCDGILHYNGTDLINIYQTEQLDLWGDLIFDKDVFFAGYTQEKRYVMIRGTLKDE